MNNFTGKVMAVPMLISRRVKLSSLYFILVGFTVFVMYRHGQFGMVIEQDSASGDISKIDNDVSRIYQRWLDAGISNQYSHAGISILERDVGKSIQDRIAGNSNQDRDSGIGNQDRDAGISNQYSEAGIKNQDRDAGISNQDRDAGISNQDRDAGISNQDRDAGISNQDRDADISNQDRGAGISNQDKDAGISNQDRGAGINNQDRDAGISNQDRDAGISNQDRDAGMSNQDRDAGISNQDRDAGMSNQGRDAGISNQGRDAGISDDGEMHVLLNSYMRSGSSFIGRVLGHRDDVFYCYEPLLKTLTWMYHKGIDEVCDYLKPHCYKRPGALPTTRRILKGVYTCQLRDLISSKLLDGITADPTKGGELWQEYHNCLDMKHDKMACLGLMDKLCSNRTTRVTKVLRLDLTLGELLLHGNSRLKIVHLFRDPRGIMNSHVFTKWFRKSNIKNTEGIDMDAQAICDRMRVDIQAAISLHEKYPDRLRGIQYEDFYNLKEKAKLLYDHLGMDSSEKYLKFAILVSLGSQETKYNTTETNKTKLFAYRQSLPWNIVQIVEKHCADVIPLLGLNLFRNEENYKDPNFSPINGHLRFGLNQIL